MSLTRFHTTQAAAIGGHADARSELAAGAKTSHWIWYVFPQLGRPGTSAMSQQYAIADLDEAVAYLADPVLGARLCELTEIVAQQLRRGVALVALLGSVTDVLKIVSCLTLFEAAARKLEKTAPSAALVKFSTHCGAILAIAEKAGYPRCAFTQKHLDGRA